MLKLKFFQRQITMCCLEVFDRQLCLVTSVSKAGLTEQRAHIHIISPISLRGSVGVGGGGMYTDRLRAHRFYIEMTITCLKMIDSCMHKEKEIYSY